MAFALSDYARLRPYLYHLTAVENLARILDERTLYSAASLARAAGRPDLIGMRRKKHVPILIEGQTVYLRDQAPLHEGNMKLDVGWSFERFVSHINRRVFFWPGGESDPISYGSRHFDRYRDEKPVVLRIGFTALLEANPAATPLFSKCNSGSPRWSRGIPGARGAQTFVSATNAQFRASQVVEVTFSEKVALPSTISYRRVGDQVWKAFPARRASAEWRLR